MTYLKTKTRITFACAAAALTALLGISSFLAPPARAQEQPMETISVDLISDVEDGYDASTSGICYEIEAPAF